MDFSTAPALSAALFRTRVLTAVALTASLLIERYAGAVPQGGLELESAELRPGLIARYSGGDGSTYFRIDAKPAFYLGDSSPHPRIAPGPFTVEWTGIFHLRETAPVTFDAVAGGEVAVEIDGDTVLTHRGAADTPAHGLPWQREPGLYRLSVRYRSLAGVPARLQLGWRSSAFAREPIPAWWFKHDGKEVPAGLIRDELAARGRTAVERLGCARCHSSAFPAADQTPPGPELSALRSTREWLMNWLDNPAQVHADARMPQLFASDREGFVDRWLVAELLLNSHGEKKEESAGDHRAGRLAFVGIGCATCHFLPDLRRDAQPDLGRTALSGLDRRMTSESLAAFLQNPHGRYPDGRMPRLPVPPDMARHIAAYLLLWSRAGDLPRADVPTPQEIDAAISRLGASDATSAAKRLVSQKRCGACHPAIDPDWSAGDIPIGDAAGAGCLVGRTVPRYTVPAEVRGAISAYSAVATLERHESPFDTRQRLLQRSGCIRCHQRDSDRVPIIEEVGSTLGGAYLQQVPFQRTPRLTHAMEKYSPSFLLAAIRDGVSGLRIPSYSYRMPAYGDKAESLVRALAEADGDQLAVEPPAAVAADPTQATLAGPSLVGFQGYSCVSCHAWDGQLLSPSDPGAIGPDLTKVTARIRRDWFDRFLDNPARWHPNTPMPSIFARGKAAALSSILDGDAGRQKDAIWHYLSLGSKAPSPKPPPPLAIVPPHRAAPPIAAQIPIRLPGKQAPVESLSVLYAGDDLLIYNVGSGSLEMFLRGGQILRTAQGRLRTYAAAGEPLLTRNQTEPAMRLIPPGGTEPETPSATMFDSYQRIAGAVRFQFRHRFRSGELSGVETLRVIDSPASHRFERELELIGVPRGYTVELGMPVAPRESVAMTSRVGTARWANTDPRPILTPAGDQAIHVVLAHTLPEPRRAPVSEPISLLDPGSVEGPLDRPGYRATAYPRPKTESGEDRIMPVALAANPVDGRLFVASMKLGEIFVLHDPEDDASSARFDDFAGGLFQEAYSMLAESDALYVLHRRNLTRISDTDHDGVADRYERLAALPHGIADTYDYAYGLVRDRTGSFVVSYAPYANQLLAGSGGAVRMIPGSEPQEIAFGFRNPLGWCTDADGEIFFTDNQGEWVATNKLGHIVEGRFYGFPNLKQKQHANKPAGRAAIWVPYEWAHSINGVAIDKSGGKFGPFAGQVFMAELMYGGAIIRANLERVNGEFQGACFPFWGKGLMGPVSLAFDPRGRLFVGGITEPGWMAQPDRGALFRIDYTGDIPFEIQSIHALPRGFRLAFTQPPDPESAAILNAYQIEHHRYEYTGAYGSPELDRTRLKIERVDLAADGLHVDLITAPLIKDRVYRIDARGVRSRTGGALVHPTGAYTLHEIPP